MKEYTPEKLVENLFVEIKLRSIDLIPTNLPKCFQNSGVYGTGISDFHILTFTVRKTYFQKAKPKIIKYRYYNHFDNNDFRDEFIRALSSNNIQSNDLARFTNISKMILEKKAPSKESYVRYNQAKLWTKSCKKQLWIVTGCWIDIERKKQKQLDLHIKDREVSVWNY